MFRVLTDSEKQAVKKARKRIVREGPSPAVDEISNVENVRVFYQHDSNFTTAIVRLSKKRIAVGVAKRNPNDKADELIGETIALTRALRSTPETI